MLVYRLSKKKYSRDLSGAGAASFGGRWNKKGIPVIYSGESIEITLLELIAHTPPFIVPDLNLLTLEIPDTSIVEIKKEELPKNWNRYPAPTLLSKIGTDWFMSMRSIALKVPSAIVFSASNYILNCRHPQFHSDVKIVDIQHFEFDRRFRK